MKREIRDETNIDIGDEEYSHLIIKDKTHYLHI